MSDSKGAEPPTPLTSLLDEISYEGNAKKYRGGGRGTENALTAEVFDCLALLPRERFLGRVLERAVGAEVARRAAVATIERADVRVLPGDVALAAPAKDDWTVQPDAIIASDTSYCLVEAKRLGRSSFQPGQIARTAIAAASVAGARSPLVLLVLGSPPPVLVRGHGRHGLESALALHEIPGHERPDPTNILAWTTWQQIAEVAADGVRELPELDASVRASIERLAHRIETLVDWHAG